MSESRGWFIGGMVFSCSYSLLQTDILKTIVLAIIGTLTSYVCGKFLAVMTNWFKKNK